MGATTNFLIININGMRDKEKRRKIFRWMWLQDAEIFFLQDIRGELNEIDADWQKEWGGH